MTAAVTIPRGFIAPLPTTPQTPSSMQQLSAKVSQLIKTRWILVTLVGLLVTAVSAVGFSAFMALTVVDAIGSGAIVGGAAALLAGLIAPKDVKAIRVATLNFLAVLSDPFEFAGDYGAFINSVKAEVNEALIGKATPKHMRKDKAAIAADLNKGPKLKHVITQKLWADIVAHIEAKNSDPSCKKKWNMDHVRAVGAFIQAHGEEKLFYAMRNLPEPFLKLDASLRIADKKTPEGFRAPIVSSPAEIQGANAQESTLNFVDYLLKRSDTLDLAKGGVREQQKLDLNNLKLKKPTKEQVAEAKATKANPKATDEQIQFAEAVLTWTKPTKEQIDNAKNEIKQIENDNATALAALQKCAGKKKLSDDELACFGNRDGTNPEGEALAYILYQAYNFALLREKDKEDIAAGRNTLTDRVNQAKTEFRGFLGDTYKRGVAFAQKLAKRDVDFGLVQEPDANFIRAMLEHGYVATDREYIDGTLKLRTNGGGVLFANTKTVNREYILFPYEKGADPKKKFARGIFQMIDGRRVYVKNIHGSSDNAMEARDEITKGSKEFDTLQKITDPADKHYLGPNAICIIAGDTNVKNEAEFIALGGSIDDAGMVATNVGRYTVSKVREVTTQGDKVGKEDVQQKDIIATKKTRTLKRVTVGFKPYQAQEGRRLPDKKSKGSDHLPVIADIE